ncbi:MAG: hypothetical protein WAO56_01770 [Miniphocaeibacter sp.]|uniref:hypothetical protein n=1 Tax=Miniphocaeibacter sp. TaxID=3100973 RepID=UPI003BB0A45C
MLIWGNKKYIVNKLIADNGFENIKKELSNLIYGNNNIEKRWDNFLSNIKGLGAASISEILSHVYPNDYAIFNSRSVKCLEYLKVEKMPKYNYQYTGSKYIEVCEKTKEIAEILENRGIKNVDLITVDYFLWDEVLPMTNAETITEKDIEEIPERETTSLHNEVQEKLVNIGNLLGFISNAEVKVAQGAIVDVVWEAAIGNMGKVIYVFEVQSKGSVDSLILNLKRAQSNPAVQAVVAVSDEKQIEKIVNESKYVIEEKNLKTWEIEEVLKVYESLTEAHESINRLGLVPDSF